MTTQAVREAPGISTAELAPEWNFLGAAEVIDGWVRLIPAKSWQVGAVVHGTKVLSDQRMTVEFDFATYGGQSDQPGDGIAVYLVDGKARDTLGGWGGALGYASNLGGGTPKPGVDGGYIGIGLDQHGMYSSSQVGTDGPGYQPNYAVIRGAGQGDTGYPYRTGQPMPKLSLPRTDPARVLVSVYKGKVTVRMCHSTTGWTTLIDDYAIPDSAPETLRLGVSAATGTLSNTFELHGLAFIPRGRRIRADFIASPREEQLKLQFVRPEQPPVNATLMSGFPAMDFDVTDTVPIQLIVQQAEWPTRSWGTDRCSSLTTRTRTGSSSTPRQASSPLSSAT
jgi:hypothetical protein